MNIRLLILALLCFCGLSASHASAEVSIVATVNDQAITSTDLTSRVRLALVGTGINAKDEAKKRIEAQILRTLIDETIQVQAAQKANITIEEKLVQEEVAKLARGNNMQPKDLPAFFAKNGASIDTLRQQIKNNMMWGVLVQRKLRPLISVGESEIDAEMTRLNAAAGKPEYLAAEIVLPVDNPKNEVAVREAAARLIDQMSKGARFSVIARQFSQAASAARGGDLGWVQPDELDPVLGEALTKLGVGGLSVPIRTAQGYSILMMREQRVRTGATGAQDPATAVYKMRQILLPVAVDATREQVLPIVEQLKSLHDKAQNCADMQTLANSAGVGKTSDFGTAAFKDLPPAVQAVVAALPVNKASSPLRNEKGVLFLMVCERTFPESSQPAAVSVAAQREAIRQKLFAAKMDLQVRRYLRDLRQEAFIDVRS